MIRLALVFATVASPVAAITLPCMDREGVLAILERAGEERRAIGMVGSDVLMELYVDPEDRTWTVLLVQTDGDACLLSGGNEWTEEAPWGKGEPL